MVLPPASESVWLNSCICDLVSKALGVVDEGSGNWTWVLSHSENGRNGVLYFALQWRLLYRVSYIVVVFDAGFLISECHVYHFQAGMLCSDVSARQATHKHFSYKDNGCKGCNFISFLFWLSFVAHTVLERALRS